MKPLRTDFDRIRTLFYYTDFTKIPVTYKIGDKKYFGMPESSKVQRRISDANIVTYTVTALTEDSLFLSLEYKQYYDFPVVEWTLYITNQGEGNSPQISEFKVFDGVIQGSDPVLLHGNGDNFRENGYSWWRDALTEEPLIKHPLMWDGNSCMGAYPYMRLIFKEYLLNIAVGWSAGWQTEASLENGNARFKAGQKKFDTYLLPNETVRTPSITLMVSDTDDESRIRNLWRSFYYAHIIPRQNGEPLRPKCTGVNGNINGTVEFTYTDEKNQLEAIDAFLKRGYKPDIWWIDAGWFPCDKRISPYISDYWKSGVGNLKYDDERYPNGMTPIGEKCAENGMDFLVWCEAERVHIGTSTYLEHPEHLLFSKSPEKWFQENALINLADPKACDWLIDTMDAFIKKNKITVYRQDFNFQPMNYWDSNEQENRVGILENLHIQGLYRYWDTLKERNPDIWIDNCAMGGRRNDIELMRRSVPLHYTDIGYGIHPIKQGQFRQMLEWIPYFKAPALAWDQPDGEYNGNKPRELSPFTFLNIMTAPSLSTSVKYDSPEEDFQMLLKFEKIWRESAEISMGADYYPLTETRRSDEDWYASQFDDNENKRGCLHFIRNIKCEQDEITVAFHVDDENLNKRYYFTDKFTDATFSKMGYELKNGFTYSAPKRSGTLMTYKICEE